MLALTRGVRQRILIGNHITVEVIKIRGNKVRLAIEAPPGVHIDREEVRQAKLTGRKPTGALPNEITAREE